MLNICLLCCMDYNCILKYFNCFVNYFVLYVMCTGSCIFCYKWLHQFNVILIWTGKCMRCSEWFTRGHQTEHFLQYKLIINYWTEWYSSFKNPNSFIHWFVGNCLEFSEGELIYHSCNQFSNGCPDTHFYDYDIYKCK